MAAAAEQGLYQFFAPVGTVVKVGGTIVLHGDFWNVDLGDRGQRKLFRIDQDLDDQSREQIRENLQQRWENGEFLTKWGHFLIRQHDIYSIFITKPVTEVDVYVDGDKASLL
jgi:hypothetical protein